MAEDSRIELLLAMLLINSMAGSSLREKAVALNRVGFSPTEIGSLLGTSSASVSQQLYAARQVTAPKKR